MASRVKKFSCGLFCRGNQALHESSSDEREAFERHVRTPAANSSRRRTRASRTVEAVRAPALPSYSPFLNIKQYKFHRGDLIDQDEHIHWTAPVTDVLHGASSSEIALHCKTSIRKGVPDALKACVITKSHEADLWLGKNPFFLHLTYSQVFGSIVPEFSDESALPTFSAGFLGAEEELHTRFLEEKTPVWHADLGRATFGRQKTVRNEDQSRINRAISWGTLDNALHIPEEAATARQRSMSVESYNALSVGYGSFSQSNTRVQYRRGSADAAAHYSASQSPVRTPQPMAQRPSRASPSRSESGTSAGRFGIHARGEESLLNQTMEEGSRSDTIFTALDPRSASAGDDLSIDRAGHAYTPAARTQQPTALDPLPLRAKFLSQTSLDVSKYTLDNATFYHLNLSHEGQNAAKRILWAVSSRFPQLEFAPLLVPLTCVLLYYVEEDVALCTILRMLQKSSELLKTDSARPFMTFRRSEFVRLVKLAQAVCTKHLDTLADRLRSLGFDLAAWLARAMQDGFSRVLPFNMVLRIMMAFLYEGMKVFLRYSLAILKLDEAVLLKCTRLEQVNAVLLLREYRTVQDVGILNELTKTAFHFEIKFGSDSSMSKFSSHDLPTPYLTHTKLPKFYRPRLDQQSTIISHDQWEVVWRFIPPTCKILDPVLRFNASKDGHSIRALQMALYQHDDSPMVFLIKTTGAEILGGYSPFPFTSNPAFPTENADNLSHASVFILKPHIAAFRWSGHGRNLLSVSPNEIIFGCDGPALWIDQELARGHSAPSHAFESPSLVSNNLGDFEIVNFEIWLLQ